MLGFLVTVKHDLDEVHCGENDNQRKRTASTAHCASLALCGTPPRTICGRFSAERWTLNHAALSGFHYIFLFTLYRIAIKYGSAWYAFLLLRRVGN